MVIRRHHYFVLLLLLIGTAALAGWMSGGNKKKRAAGSASVSVGDDYEVDGEVGGDYYVNRQDGDSAARESEMDRLIRESSAAIITYPDPTY